MQRQIEGSEWVVTAELPKGSKWIAEADSWDDALNWAFIFHQGEFSNIRIDLSNKAVERT
jgi:hypothetical protein